MKSTLFTLFMVLAFMATSQAQNNAIHVTSLDNASHDHTSGRNCAAHTVLQEQMQADPILERRMLDMEEKTQRYMREARGTGGRFTAREIPVYVHIIYRTSQENISDAQIQSQIDQINADFAATNSDYNTPDAFGPERSGNTGISFKLEGVTRKQSNTSSWGTNDAMKRASSGGVNPITPETHLNMWVCNIGGGILGYAQFPGGSLSTDGVVMSPQYFGSINYGNSSGYYLSAPFDRGRTTTHEIGHYLNLRHIWGDGNCNADDGVSDTPVAGRSNGGCPAAGTNSCSGGKDDMFMNYMDYTNDACMYMFSNGQKLRMQACLEGPRVNLGTATGGGGGGGGGTPTCYGNITLSITTDNYGSETSWTITNAGGSTVASGSGYANNTTYNPTIPSLPDGNYTFTINDSYGDGICCSFGNGSYTLRGDGTTIQSGGAFTSSESVAFCVQGSTGGGGGGGGCTSINVSDSWESNLEGWTNDTGDDFDWVRRSGGTPSRNTGPSSAQNGSQYIYMEASGSNNPAKRAIITSPSQNLTGTCNPEVSFYYHMYGRSDMGTLALQVSVNNGTWTTIWSESGNQGNTWLQATVDLNSYKGSNVRFRFNGITGGYWQGDIAVDNFRITGSSSARQSNATEVAEEMVTEMRLFPNPASQTINAELTNIDEPLMGRIVDATGRTLWVGQLGAGQNSINISTLPTGLYYLAVVREDGNTVTEKFIKQ